MPVQLTKLVMSASVTVRPIVLNCRPTGKSSKQKPSPTASIPSLSTSGASAGSALSRSREVGRLAVGDGRQAGFAAGIVDDLQYALPVGQILQPEFLDQPGVVDQVIAGGLLAAGLVLKADLRVGQELAQEIGEIAEADGSASRIVD